jgi:hypothetical protein
MLLSWYKVLESFKSFESSHLWSFCFLKLLLEKLSEVNLWIMIVSQLNNSTKILKFTAESFETLELEPNMFKSFQWRESFWIISSLLKSLSNSSNDSKPIINFSKPFLNCLKVLSLLYLHKISLTLLRNPAKHNSKIAQS